MMAVPDHGVLVDLLDEQFAALDELSSTLSAADWHRSSGLPGWSVLDVFAHVIGSERMLEGCLPPAMATDLRTMGHVRNQRGAFNEAWVEALGELGPAAMLEAFADIVKSRLASVTALSPMEYESERPGPTGNVPYWRLLQLRIFDLWMHEQDIRESLGRPGNERGRCAEAAVDEVERALPQLVGERAAAAVGSTVTILLTGPVFRAMHVAVDPTAELVEALDGPPTIRISLSSSLLMRLAGGRTGALADRLGSLDFEGDLDLAQRIVGNLTLTD